MPKTTSSIAIIQPYIFPYIGYFHLLESATKTVFYDDVNFKKKGWINRNTLLNIDKPKLFTIPLIKASQNKKINEIKVVKDDKWKNDLYNLINSFYKKAPFYNSVIDMIMETVNYKNDAISELSINSIINVYKYLNLHLNYDLSSNSFSSSIHLKKADRLIEITKSTGAKKYINPIGGQELYEKSFFKSKGVDLFFINSANIEYNQFKKPFTPNLSIIDVLMFNDTESVKKMFNEFDLI